jgi:spore coat protein A, manganese oxidase
MTGKKGNVINQDEKRNSRRRFIKLAGIAAGATAVTATVTAMAPGPLRKTIEDSTTLPLAAAAPATLKKLTPYVDPLPIPPLAQNLSPTGSSFDYYELSIAEGGTLAQPELHKFHRDLQPTTTQSYFGGWPLAGTVFAGFNYLGPTIIAQKGKPVKVKVTNNLPLQTHLITRQNILTPMDYTIMGTTDPNQPGMTPWADEARVCVHLHGGKVKTEFDGGPRDWFSPVGSSQVNPYPEKVDPLHTGVYTYEYPNNQDAAMLWYHDHAWGITRFNPFLGHAAAYIIRDEYENALINGTSTIGGYNPAPSQKIPSGKYEVPIVLQDRLLDLVSGAMIYPITPTPGFYHPLWIPEYFGDTPIVNGKAYPYLDVEPRKYRFRFLNGSQARFYSIWFNDAVAGLLPMWVIGSEQGFLPAPVMVTRLLISPGERFDTIFDFTGMPNGTILTLKNNAKAPYPGGRGGDIPNIMQFRVTSPPVTDDTTQPGSLILPPIDPTPTKTSTIPPREIVLQELMDQTTGQPKEVLLDTLPFADPNPTTILPPLITENNHDTNIWQFINTTGDAHPMHMHLVKFKIVDRQPFDTKAFLVAWNLWVAGGRTGTRPSVNTYLTKGAAYLPAPEETGWKDTAKAYPGEVLRIIATFDLPTGLAPGEYKYVCHCHILEHEENDMMFYYAVRTSTPT